MKVLSLLFIVLLASPSFARIGTQSLVHTSRLVKSDIYSIGKTPIAKPDLSICPLCVDFMNESINALLNIILQGGVLGSCGALCGQLKSQVEAVICNLLCDYVGINVFIDLIQDADPDPIWICEEIKVCPVCVGNATITSLTVSPSSGPVGSTFNIDMQFNVAKAICTGEIAIEIDPPASSGGFPFGDGELVTGFATGQYGVKFSLQAEPNQQEPFSPGQYGVIMAICAGSCGSIHSHSITYTEKKTTFTITGN